jgi:hypothetical protein
MAQVRRGARSRAGDTAVTSAIAGVSCFVFEFAVWYRPNLIDQKKPIRHRLNWKSGPA